MHLNIPNNATYFGVFIKNGVHVCALRRALRWWRVRVAPVFRLCRSLGGGRRSFWLICGASSANSPPSVGGKRPAAPCVPFV